jgi:hypothetical protein
LNFAAGQTTASFTVTALTDSILESPETVNLVLSGPNASSNPSILTINDVPQTGTTTGTTPTAVGNTYFFGAANYSVPEGSTVPITINRSGNLSIPGAILFSTSDGSAQSTGGSLADYQSVSQSISFAPGQSSVQVPVTTLFDSLTENTETVGLFLSGGTLASPSLAVLSIIDGNSAVAPASFYYGPSPGSVVDNTSATFTINRNGNTAVAASVDYLIVPPGPGQPLNTIDYSIMSPLPGSNNITGGTVNFNPGQTSVSLMINNPLGLAVGVVSLGFGPGVNVGNPPSTSITLL